MISKFAIVTFLFFTSLIERDLSAQTYETYRPHDFSFISSYDYANPFIDVAMTATFRGPGGRELSIPAFFNGGRSWVARFSPTIAGSWTYTTSATDSSNSGLHGRSGSFFADSNRNPNINGVLRVDPQYPHHFIYENGQRCFPLGYEADWLWALDPYDLSAPNVSALADDMVDHGFNLATFNLYAFDTLWSPGNSNPWDFGPPAEILWEGTNNSPDYFRLNLEFFQAFDAMMDELWERGILAHLMFKVYNKGVNWPDFRSPGDDVFWHYTTARYQAYPNVIWDTGKESYNVERNVNTGYSANRIAFIDAIDAYDHLATVHDPDRAEVDDAGDFKSDQVHFDHYEDALFNFQTWDRPYFNMEFGYEEGVDDLPTYPVSQRWDEVLSYTWKVTLGGGYANYYYSNTAWDLVKADPEPPGYHCYRYYRDFWERTRYWELDPAPDLVTQGNGVFCRANRGREYVLYSTSDSSFRFVVSNAQAPLEGFWLNTETGEEELLPQTYGNGEHTMVPPWQHAVLYIVDSSGPVASFHVSNEQPLVGESVTFDASDSYSPGSPIVGYEWDFDGDGQPDDEGEVVDHAYTSNGVYSATVLVVDSRDRTDVDTQSIIAREPSGGLHGTYFNDINLSDLVFSRTDAMINFSWGSGVPDPRIDNDQAFSARWTGWYHAFSSGTYEFCTVSNDGVRLKVRDQLIIENWTQHGDTEDCSGALSLNAGWHKIALEFFQNGGSSRINLSASGPGFGKQLIPSERLKVSLNPVIHNAGVTPSPYSGGAEARLWARVSDPDGIEDIAGAESYWFASTGGFLGVVPLAPWPGDPQFYVASLGVLDLPPWTWTVFFRVRDRWGLPFVYGPFLWTTL